MKKYEVIIQNNDATPESDTRNIQFLAGGKLCNFPENTPVIISEHAYNNLMDSVQVRHKWDVDKQIMVPYNFKRYPTTLIRVIEEPDDPQPVVEEPKVQTFGQVVEPVVTQTVVEAPVEEGLTAAFA